MSIDTARKDSGVSFHLGLAKWIGRGSFAFSIVMHAVLVAAGASVSGRLSTIGIAPAGMVVPTLEVDVETASESIELPSVAESSSLAVPVVAPPPFDPGGETPIPRPDGERAGRGGTLHADAPAINLADRNDGVLLSQEVASRINRNQVQRARSATARSSYDDRRSVLDPMEVVFLATGTGRVHETRPRAWRDPSEGALRAEPAARRGVAFDPERIDLESASPRMARTIARGGRSSSPGLGLLHGAPGTDRRLSANVALGRPMVARASTSVPSARIGPVRDSVDSQQEVASALQSIVHASTAGGVIGDGPGGQPGAGPTGAGGLSGSGSRATPAGRGTGHDLSYDEADPRITAYRRAVLAKIAPLWGDAFPKWAAIEGRQGHTVVQFVIWPDGRLDQLAVARASGVAEFDVNVRNAVARASPFPPLPSGYAEPYMRWSITFDARNPVVR